MEGVLLVPLHAVKSRELNEAFRNTQCEVGAPPASSRTGLGKGSTSVMPPNAKDNMSLAETSR